MRQRGYTLVEMLVVTAILALTAAVLVPSLSFRRTDVERARAELESLVRLLRAEASAKGRLHRLRVDVDGGRLVPEVLAEDRFEPMEDTLGEPRRLSVDRIRDLVTTARKAVALQVAPGGFVEPALLEVEVEGEVYTLSVHALTGRVEARPGRARQR